MKTLYTHVHATFSNVTKLPKNRTMLQCYASGIIRFITQPGPLIYYIFPPR